MVHALILAAATAYPTAFSALSVKAAEALAITNSPDVRGAAARVAQSEAALAAARGSVGPAAFANYSQSPQAGLTNNTVLQQLTTVGAQVTMGDLLSYTPQVQAAQAALRGSRADLLSAQATERTKVLAFYYDALRAVATYDVRATALSVAQADRRAAQVRFDAGDAPRLDVVRAAVAVARATADLATAQAERDNALAALGVETGMPAGTLSAVASTPPQTTVPTPESAVRRALELRPEIASAQAAVKTERAAVSSAALAVLPAVTAQVGYTHGTDTGIPVAGASANVTVTLPLSASSVSRTDLERARLTEAEAKLAAQEREITVDVAAAVRTFDADRRASDAARAARIAAETELAATETGYRNGASSSLDVASARQTYNEAVLDELSAYYAQMEAQETLDVLMGS
ncbi:MAG: TolC family protein [Candidatus Eremiobacteraeota bacterium]|nr:TolC family protein [Candidatus Eremiobacteraeota bacterium]